MKDNNIREAAEKLTKALEILNSRHKDTTGLGAVITLLKEVKWELTKAEGEKEEEGWISVDDRKPNEGQGVMIALNTGLITVGYLKNMGTHRGWQLFGDVNVDLVVDLANDEVTHWCIYPNLPTDKQYG